MSKQEDKDSKLKSGGKATDEPTSNAPSVTSSNVAYGYTKGYSYGYGYGASSSGAERTLKDYPLILLRYWPLILCLTLLGMGIAVYKTKRTPRIYQSSSMIDIGVYVPVTDGPTSTQLEEDTRRANYINTQTSLLKSLTMAQIVLNRNPEILEYVTKGLPADFKISDNSTTHTNVNAKLPVHLLQTYIGAVSFQKLDGTSLVRIFAKTRNPEMSSRIANSHAEGFITLVKERRERAATLNEKFIRNELKEATDKVRTLEKKRIEHAKSNSLIASGSSILEETYASKFKGLADNLNSAISNRVRNESRYRQLKSRNGVAIIGGGSGNSEENEVARIRIQVERLEAQYEVLFRKVRNRRHPELIQLRDQIDAAKSVLRELGKERLKDARDNYYASSRREQYLQNEFSKLKDEEIETSRHKVQHDILTQRVQSAKEAQKALQKRLDEILVNVKSDQQTVFLIDRAFPATHHISPNEVANLWNGCLLGAFFGLLLAILLDFLDNTVRSVRDLQDSIQIPVLGVVPEFSKALMEKTDPLAVDPTVLASSVETLEETSAILEELGQKASDPAYKVSKQTPVPLHYAPFSQESEAFRSVLVALTSAEQEESSHKILITSGQKGDGKTTLAINLAIALAQMGERTLLVDADLRVPSLHEYFQSNRDQEGLVDCVEDGKPSSEVIFDVGIENLHILLSGRSASNPVRLLRSNRLAQFMDELSEEFDYVIIDSAPIAPVSDALLLSRHVDGVAVVVRSGETPQLVAESAVARLRQVGANILGLVLNDASTSHLHWKIKSGYGAYGNYGYTSYSDNS